MYYAIYNEISNEFLKDSITGKILFWNNEKDADEAIYYLEIDGRIVEGEKLDNFYVMEGETKEEFEED